MRLKNKNTELPVKELVAILYDVDPSLPGPLLGAGGNTPIDSESTGSQSLHLGHLGDQRGGFLCTLNQ